MTVQQEAIRIINSMPDDTVSVLVELLKRMKGNDSYPDDFRVAENLRIQPQKRRLGIADGKYIIPDNIDICNDEIAKMFEVAE